MSTTLDAIARPGVAAWEQRLDDVLATIAQRASEHDRHGSFPHDAFEDLRPLGLVPLTVPRALGGAGAGLATSAGIVERVGAADPSVGLVLIWQLIFQAELARAERRWPAAVRDRVQHSAVRDGDLINALRVEPDLGTPARGGLPGTIAERRPGEAGWRLRGHKIYCTGIPALRWLAVWAATDDDEPLVGTFLVERGTPGYRVEDTWDHLGLRASGTHDVILEGVEIPLDHAVDVRAPAEWKQEDRRDGLAWATLLMAANYTGIAVAARDWLVGYLNERTPTNLGAPLASLPHFQQAVGEIEALLEVSHTLLRDVTRDVDAGVEGAADRAPLVKHIATANTTQVTEIALRLTGNPGLSRTNPLERHHRDGLTGRVHTPQSDMVLGGLGRAALGRSGGGLRVLG
ncbi:MAG: Acyl-CoA dehydrogenase type 2 domain protein [Solirubrobacterales bacterium]|nr:Acyl-CoA dehydrogenase type 2 domain protein [Solirubrobacterales bacterium]